MKEIIIASILFAVSVFLFFMSVRSFMEKGFLFNNAYIYASKQEREKMNKKPYYRQSAIVFLLLGIVFLLLALAVLLEVYWIYFVGVSVVIITLIYAIVSSITIEKNKKQ
ncbi:MAG: DUF3784 domain-containing protein [Clostridia bacterium]|nr:DUF3784 domain-containing protein [Clostridia bacterium]